MGRQGVMTLEEAIELDEKLRGFISGLSPRQTDFFLRILAREEPDDERAGRPGRVGSGSLTLSS
jgi:hypothetical protein